MPVAWATIETRLRDRLVESTAAFWTQAELIEWYDQGAALCHRRILENARATGKLARFEENDYLRTFGKKWGAANLTVDQREYALSTWSATDLLELLHVTVDVSSGTYEALRAQRVRVEDDWRILNCRGQWGPAADRPLYAVTPEGKLWFYFDTTDTKPKQAHAVALYGIREVVKTASAAGNVDLVDPFNIGPIAHAMGLAKGKQGRDPGPWFAERDHYIEQVMPGPLAADVRPRP